MGYVGRGLNQDGGQYRKLDDISSTFNGSNTSFSLAVSNVAVTPTAQNLLISINGVIQEPGSAFSMNGSTITFTEAPAGDSTFFGVVMGEASFIAHDTVGANEMGVTAGTVKASRGVVVDSSKNISGFNKIEIANSGSTDDALLITSTEDSSTASPVITLKRNSGSPADADYLGQFMFKGENDNDQEITYAKVTGKIQDASDGSEDGLIEFANKKAGSNVITARLRSDSFQLLNSTNFSVAGTSTMTGNVTLGGNISGSSSSTGSVGRLQTNQTNSSFGGNILTVEGTTNVNQDLTSDASPTFAGGTITGDFSVGGTLTAQEIHTEFTSASILFTSGSTQFGNSSDDVHNMTGSLNISGSLFVKDGALTVNDVLSANSRINTTEVRGSSVAIKDANADLMAWFQDGSSRLYSNGYNLRLESNNELNLYNANTAATVHINYHGAGSRVDIANTELDVIKGTGSTFAGNLTVDKSISAGDLNTAPIVTFKNSQGSGHYTAIKFEGADGSGANTGFIGYMSHNTKTTRRFVISHDGVNRDFAINSGSLATFIGNINQEKAGNLRHTILATGNGEAALHLHANNSTGDSFIRFQTDSTTFAMGFDNSDGDKWILSVGSDPHSDSIINIQPDGSIVTFDKAANFNSTVTIGANPAKLSVGAAAFSSAGSGYDFVQVGHSAGFFCETADAADRNAFIGNNMYHNGSNWRTLYEDQVSAIQFRAGTIRFNTAGVTATSSNLTTGGGDERMRITTDGTVHIKAGNPNTTEDAVLYVSKTGENDWSQFLAAGSDDYGLKINGGGSYAIMVTDHDQSSAATFRVHYNGTIYSSNTSVQSISDRRLKENIVDANSQWNDIKGLKFKNFNWKESTGRDTSITYLGLIADEVESVSPNLVEIDAQPKEDIETGVTDPEYKNVKYSIVWMKAVKALQEAMEKIETLESQMAQVSGSS